MPKTTRAVKPSSAVVSGFTIGFIAAGDLLCDRFVVIRTIRPHETDHSGVYLCHDNQFGRVIVKVYPRNSEPDQALWQLLQTVRHPNLVPILYTIFWHDVWAEVQPWYSGGSLLDKYMQADTGMIPMPVELIENSLVPQVCEALSLLHDHGYVHRDVKPGNIFIQPSDHGDIYLLGDYDICSPLTALSTHRHTTRAAGTWIYTAPEAFPRYLHDNGEVGTKVTRAIDYYSLGVSLLELAVGITPLHTCRLPDLYDFYVAGMSLEPPSSLSARMRLLLSGLLIRQPKLRWGAAELRRWLTDTNTNQDLARIDEAQDIPLQHRQPRSLNYCDVHVQTPQQLASLMVQELDQAALFLKQPEGLWSWLGAVDCELAVCVRKQYEALKGVDGREMALACLLDPHLSYEFHGQVIHTVAEWLAIHQQHVASAWITDGELNRLIYWQQFHAEGDATMAGHLAALREVIPSIRRHELQWAVNPHLPLTLRRGCDVHTPEQFASTAYGIESDWISGRCENYQRAMVIWQDGILESWLRQRGYGYLAEKSEQLRTNNTDQPIVCFERLLHTMNLSLPKPRVELEKIENIKPPYRTPSKILIAYHTKGVGIPVLHVRWEQHPELQPCSELIVCREGIIGAEFGSEEGQTSGRGSLKLTVTSDNAVIPQMNYEIPYQVVDPNGGVWFTMLASTVFGASIFGVSRSIMLALGLVTVTADMFSILPFVGALGNATQSHKWVAAQLGVAVWVSLMTIGYICMQVIRSRVERLEVNSVNSSLTISPAQLYGMVLFIIVTGFAGNFITFAADMLMCAWLSPENPQMMWLLWGAIYGAVAGFWLISPIRGWMHLRRTVLCVTIVIMVVCATMSWPLIRLIAQSQGM